VFLVVHPAGIEFEYFESQRTLRLAKLEGICSDCDAYVEKPFAETMEDNRIALKPVQQSGKIVQVGSQRRSGGNYRAGGEFIMSGKFGYIIAGRMTTDSRSFLSYSRHDYFRRILCNIFSIGNG